MLFGSKTNTNCIMLAYLSTSAHHPTEVLQVESSLPWIYNAPIWLLSCSSLVTYPAPSSSGAYHSPLNPLSPFCLCVLYGRLHFFLPAVWTLSFRQLGQLAATNQTSSSGKSSACSAEENIHEHQLQVKWNLVFWLVCILGCQSGSKSACPFLLPPEL